VRLALCPADDCAIFGLEAAGAELFIPDNAPDTAIRLAARHARSLFRLRRAHDRQRIELSLRARRGGSGRAAHDPSPLGEDPFARIIRAPGSPMAQVCATAARVASFDVPALILGETGTGKELLARAMHGVSRRADRPFHALNCGAIPDELLEAELFGHRKGAFTGAHADRVGLLEQAHQGTVFLDEIGETSPAFQVKLLRFLQEGEIRPVGSNDTRTVNVRVIAACNRELIADDGPRGFRSDLYWRLAVAPLHLPPLRERPGDLPLIAEALLDRAVEQHGKHVDGISREAMALLCAWHWPGNIRELENEITRMLVMASGHKLGPELVAPRILHAAPGDADPVADDCAGCTGNLRERVEQLEARILRETLIRLKGNKSRAAEELGLSRVGLRAKLDRYGLSRIDQPIRAAE
jgi:two-component system response regulator HupR/HoxA